MNGRVDDTHATGGQTTPVPPSVIEKLGVEDVELAREQRADPGPTEIRDDVGVLGKVPGRVLPRGLLARRRARGEKRDPLPSRPCRSEPSSVSQGSTSGCCALCHDYPMMAPDPRHGGDKGGRRRQAPPGYACDVATAPVSPITRTESSPHRKPIRARTSSYV